MESGALNKGETMDRKKAIPTVEVYEGRRATRGAWYWRCIAANGHIKADGGEDYGTKAAAIKGVQATLLPPYLIVVKDSDLSVRPKEIVGVVHPVGLNVSDNPRNYATVEIETIR
jgi:uncharacterized protein YegP (UPF0339 family)